MGHVACKLPNGIHVRHFDKDTQQTHEFTLNGANHRGAFMGFGITRNVDKGLFDAWRESADGLSAAFDNGSIFYFDGRGNVEEVVRERAHDKRVRTGLEPLGDDDLKEFKIEPTEETKAEMDKTAEKQEAARGAAK